MKNDPVFKKQMDDLFKTDVIKSMEPRSGTLKNPPNTHWHHPLDRSDKGTMWLLDKKVHTDPNLQKVLHSNNGKGGFAEGNF